jgi:DNA-binding response OmpR family regulator
MSEATHILVVDDEPEIGRMIDAYLTKEGYRVSSATNGARMREILNQQTVDLVILDLILPGEDGLEIARALRAKSNIGIIMLTGRIDLVDRVVGLEVGADDYLAKPADLRELLARVRSVLRRKGSEGAGGRVGSWSTARFAGWRLDLNARELTAASGERIPLTTAEFRLLVAFVTSPQKALDRDHLLALVAEREWTPYDRSVDVLIGKLRQKIEPDPKVPTLIKTERGVGYVFSAEVELS